MRLVARPITPGSYSVFIWTDVEAGEGEPAGRPDATCVINWLNQKESELSPVFGRSTASTIVELAQLCKTLGFEAMHFRVRRGTPLGSIATYIKTVDGLDYYRYGLGEE